MSAPTTRTWYVQTSATIAVPVFVEIPDPSSGEAEQIYPYSITISDYTTPDTAVATSANGFDIENFDDDTGWTLTGNSAITGGKYESGDYNNNVAETAKKSLSADLTNANFTADFDFIFNSGGSVGNSLGIFCLSNFDDVRGGQGSGDSIHFLWNTESNKIKASYTADSSTRTGDITLSTVLVRGTQYYARLDRTSTTNVNVEIYSDSARTTLVTSGSLTITSAVNNLDRISMAYGEGSGANSSGNITIDNILIDTGTGDSPTNVLTDNTTAQWKSDSEASPAIYVEMSAVKDGAAIMLNIDRTNTTITEITLRASVDATFTSAENVRTVLVSDLTDDTDEFYRFNRLDEDKQYYQIIGTGTGVLAIFKLFVLIPTDWDRQHKHKDISTSDTSLDGEGN